METYLVFSSKLACWWGAGSVWVSALDQAKRFSRDDAIKFCQRRFTQGTSDCFPVAEADVIAVMKK